jgi:hypothetical protein
LAWALLNCRLDQPLLATARFERIALQERDLCASQLLQAVQALLEKQTATGRIKFAIDAPIGFCHVDSQD